MLPLRWRSDFSAPSGRRRSVIARPPNYKFERRKKDREKAEKKAEKLAAKAARRAAKAAGLDPDLFNADGTPIGEPPAEVVE